jgi:hypothetical protein
LKRLKDRSMLKKSILIFISLMVLAFTGSCGKKGDPMPKGRPVPAAISDLGGQVRDGVLFLSFTVPTSNMDGTPIKDLAGFRFLKSCGSCSGSLEPFKDVRFDENKGYTTAGGRLYIYDDDLAPGVEYTYLVYPLSASGSRGDASNRFSIRWQKPPEPPKNASIKTDDGRLDLAWSAEPGRFYNVYRYVDSSYPLFPSNAELLRRASFQERGLENGKKYRYSIRAVAESDGRKWEGEGLIVEATPKDMTPPAAPLNLVGQKKGTSIALSWGASKETDVAGYNLYRIVGGKPEKLNKELVRGITYVDGNLPDSRYVSYYVTAVDSSGNESEPSREAIIVIKE